MILLNGSNIKKMFLDETLFDSVSFNVDSNDKIGFIGVNGAGKSTLFKIITGDMDYDEGEIFKNKGLRVGYLDQYSVNGSEKSIWEETLTVFADVIEMENQLDEIRFDIENNNVKLLCRKHLPNVMDFIINQKLKAHLRDWAFRKMNLTCV